MTKCETVIVGAGPYGLSIAAHLRAANAEHAVIGSPMESWRAHMPRGMVLKSERFASNLSDADRRYTLDRFCALRGKPVARKGVPLPMSDFLDYADWFRRNAVPDIWDNRLRRLRRIPDGFELILDDRVVLAKRVILATGHLAYRHFPEALQDLAQDASELVSHAADHPDLAKFAGKTVTVIGCGQSGLETAALLSEHGANVQVLARSSAIAWDAEFDPAKSAYKRMRWPESGLGDGWRSLGYSELPRAFALLPKDTRRRIVAKANGPSGAWWLKQRVIGRIPLHTDHHVTAAAERNGRVQLSVQRTGGTAQIETDHVIAGTGYRVDLSRLPFLDAALREAITTFAGPPILKGAFESSVPNLHFVGLASAMTFGPVMRFVYGTRHAATILSTRIASSAGRRRVNDRYPVTPDEQQLKPIGIAERRP